MGQTVISRPIDWVPNNPTSGLTHEELQRGRSFDAWYRRAIGRIRTRKVFVKMGKSYRKIPTTDLMVILRDCRSQLGKGTIGPTDFGYVLSRLRWLGSWRDKDHVIIPVRMLLKLRKIAYRT